jgi:uncharacterized iron-regulated membrane protein
MAGETALDAPDALDATDTQRLATPAYRAIWRWHFIAGLFVAPVLILMTISGSLYLFDREIEGWWNRDIQTIAPGATPLPLAEQQAAVLAASPGAEVQRVRLPHRADEAAIWSVKTARGARRDVYLDPYRGTVTGAVDPAMQPMDIVRRIHGTLLAGDAGSYVVELVACWTLVMLATGLMLWWPKRWKARGVVVPRWSAGGRRLLRDLHAIPSALNMLFIALLILTGLPWSVFWGSQFARLGEHVPFIAPTPNFAAHLPAAVAGAHAEHAEHAPDMVDRRPWVVQNSPQPAMAGHGAAHAHGPGGIAAVEPLLARLDRAHFGEGVRIIYPDTPGGLFTINYIPDRAEGQRTIYATGDGRVQADIGWAEYSPFGKAIEWGTMTHMGRQYGLANQLANLAVCLALIGSIVAGLSHWWRRRPSGQLGVPQLRAEARLPRGLVIALGAMGVLFPLVGLTMLLAVGIGRLRRWAWR